MVKYYYFIEDLDITDDKIPDGVLVRQLKINKEKGIYNYIKNFYISEKDLREIIENVIIENDKKGIEKIIVSNSKLNKIRNKHVPFDEIPRIVISNKSYFSHLIKNKKINLIKLINIFNKYI